MLRCPSLWYGVSMARRSRPAPEPEPEVTYAPVEEGYVCGTTRDIWRHDDTGHMLTVEESLFCRSYIVDRNPIAAMKRLNYSGENEVLRRRAERMLSNPEVQSCIEVLAERMMERLEITADRVQQAIAAVAFFDPREVVTFDGTAMNIKDSKFWTQDQIRALKGLKQTQFGVEIQFHDRLRAAEMLSKQLGVQPEDDAASTLAAMKAGADAVLDSVMKVFDRTVPETPALPSPPSD